MKVKSTSSILSQLRTLMGSLTCAEQKLHALIVPSSDAHQVHKFSIKAVAKVS